MNPLLKMLHRHVSTARRCPPSALRASRAKPAKKEAVFGKEESAA